jgi:hypothetical protein
MESVAVEIVGSAMAPSTPQSDADARGWRSDEEIVDRLIRGDWQLIRERLCDPAALVDVPVHFDGSFERVDRIAEFWRASGRIERHGRLERIEIEVSQASAYSADLRVLPMQGHHFQRSRKRRDWLIEVADRLEAVLTDVVIDVTYAVTMETLPNLAPAD